MKGVRLRRPSGVWTDPIFDDHDVELAVRRRAHRIDGPVHISHNGAQFGPWLTVTEGAARLLVDLRGQVGMAVRMWNKDKKGIEARVVETAPTPANTSGSPGVDLVVGFLNVAFAGQWESWGIYVYKYIAGTTEWSDHSYVNHVVVPNWCGRAIDAHPHSMAIGDQIKAAAMGEPSIANNLRYLLWRVPDHFSHLHFSLDDPGSPGRC